MIMMMMLLMMMAMMNRVGRVYTVESDGADLISCADFPHLTGIKNKQTTSEFKYFS